MVRILKETRKDPLQQTMDLPDMFSEDVEDLINEANESGIDLKKYIKPKHQLAQVSEILIGLERGVDVTKYNKLELDYRQMQEVRLGLEKKVDLTFLPVEEYGTGELKEIRLALQNGVTPKQIEKHMLGKSFSEMQQARKKLERGLLEGYLKESRIPGISDIDLDKIIEEVLGDTGLKRNTDGTYTMDIYVDKDDLDSFCKNQKEIQEIIDKGYERFIASIDEMYSGFDYSEYIDYYVNNIVKKLNEEIVTEDTKAQLSSILWDMIVLAMPYKEYGDAEITVKLRLGTDKEKASNWDLIPTTTMLEEGGTFEPQSALVIIAMTQKVTVSELNTLYSYKSYPNNKGVFFKDLWNAYFGIVGDIQKHLDSVCIVIEMPLIDAIKIKCGTEGFSFSKIEISDISFVISSSETYAVSEDIRTKGVFRLPSNLIKDVLVGKQDLTKGSVRFI